MRRHTPTQMLSLVLLCIASATGAAFQPPRVRGFPANTEGASADPPLLDLQDLCDLRKRARGKPLLVNFWATWCEPCRDEYPVLNELAQKYGPQGLIVVGISLDDDTELAQVRSFLGRTRPVFRNFRKRPGKEEEFINGVNPKWSGAIPATFFYARDGHEQARLIGEHSRKEFEKAIQSLLEAAPQGNGAPERKSR